MKNKIRLSVMVPFFNERKNLIECVDSLLNQNYPQKKYEIILVDNNSTDKSKELLSRYSNKVKVVFEQRTGRAEARNKGIRVARGEILVFTDADCVFDRNWLKNLADSFSSKKIAAVAGELKAYKPETDIERFYERLISHERSLSEVPPYAGTANLAVRKEICKKIIFDSNLPFTSDVDFCWRLQELGFKIVYKSEAIAYHKNVRTITQLFSKIVVQNYYLPKLLKKDLRIVEKYERLKRVSLRSYIQVLKLFKAALLSKDKNQRKEMLLQFTALLARKIGLLLGSIRFGFFYLE